MADVVKHGGKESTMVFITLDTETTLATLWDHEELEVMCRKDELWREAGEMERSTPSQKRLRMMGKGWMSTSGVSGHDGRTG